MQKMVTVEVIQLQASSILCDNEILCRIVPELTKRHCRVEVYNCTGRTNVMLNPYVIGEIYPPEKICLIKDDYISSATEMAFECIEVASIYTTTAHICGSYNDMHKYISKESYERLVKLFSGDTID